MLSKELTKDIKNRLSSLKGQVEGVIKMLDNSDDPAQILNQFKAISKGFENAQHLLLDEVYRKTLAMKISEAIEACPGNCGQEERIEIIKNQFPDLGLYELTDKMKEIDNVYEYLLKKKENIKEISFVIDNMVCQGCSEKISEILKETKGVEEVNTKAMKKLVTIHFSPTETNKNELIAILTKAGYKPKDKI